MSEQFFKSIEDIPDLVPEELILPAERNDFSVPRLENHSIATTTPVEVGHILFTEPGNLFLFRQVLQNHNRSGERPESFLTRHGMNHCGRAIVRAALDPEREAPIGMLDIYSNEIRLGARFPNENDTLYFRTFLDTFGVLERPMPES